MSRQFRFSALMLAVILLLLPINAIIFAEEELVQDTTGQETSLTPEATTSTIEETNQVKVTYRWICPYCGQVNNSYDTICVFCKNKRPGDAQIIVEEASKEIVIKKDVKKLKWLCPQCGNYNNFGATKCFSCKEPKPATTSSNYQLFYPVYHHPTMQSTGKTMMMVGGIAIGASIALSLLAFYGGSGEKGLAIVFVLPAIIGSCVIFSVGVALKSMSDHSLEMIPVNPTDYENLGYNSLDNYRLLTERPKLSNDYTNLFAVGFEF